MVEQSDSNNLISSDESDHSERSSSESDECSASVLTAEELRRVNGLKNIQLDLLKTELKFYEEVHQLELKYLEEQTPLFEKRKKIVMGTHEPTDEEGKWAYDSEVEDELKEPKDTKNVAKTTGIPDFWLSVFKSVTLIKEMIEPQDEDVLRHLIDVKLIPDKDTMGFKLEFHFAPNVYFTNSVLTKTYEMKNAIDEEDPLGYEGPEIVRTEGCKINWNKGKNVTVKTVKRKQKHKNKADVRTVTKQVDTDSFFNFFNPPEAPKDGEEKGPEYDGIAEVLEADFEVGHFMKERIIPKAILYFTGDLVDEDEEDEEEEQDEECDVEESDEGDHVVKKLKGKKPGVKTAGGTLTAGMGDGAPPNPSECKNQ